MIPFIQRTCSRSKPASAELACFSVSIAIDVAQHLDRHGRDVVVGPGVEGRAGGRERLVHGLHPNAGDAVAVARDRLDAAAHAVVHAESLQLAQPGVDPDIARRPVQHAVDLSLGLGKVLQELQQDVAAACARSSRGRARRQATASARRRGTLKARLSGARRRRTPTSSAVRTVRSAAHHTPRAGRSTAGRSAADRRPGSPGGSRRPAQSAAWPPSRPGSSGTARVIRAHRARPRGPAEAAGSSPGCPTRPGAGRQGIRLIVSGTCL